MNINMIPISSYQERSGMGIFGSPGMNMRASDPWVWAAIPAHDTHPVLRAHEKCRACPLEITVIFPSNTSNRLIRGLQVKGEGA